MNEVYSKAYYIDLDLSILRKSQDLSIASNSPERLE